jgi:hypothetical protein
MDKSSAIQKFYESLKSDMDVQEIREHLYRQQVLLEKIDRNTRFADNLRANILGNAIFDGSVFLISKLIKRI